MVELRGVICQVGPSVRAGAVPSLPLAAGRARRRPDVCGVMGCAATAPVMAVPPPQLTTMFAMHQVR